MPRTIHPAEDALIDQLFNLGVGSAVQTVREALRIGYTVAAIREIVDWYVGQSLVDPDTGERVSKFWPGQLVQRLRDDRARAAKPEHWNWGGGSAEWSALNLRLNPGTGPRPAGEGDRSPSARARCVDGLSWDQAIVALGLLVEQGGEIGERAQKCLTWSRANWSPEDLLMPRAVRKFLMECDVQRLLR